MMSFDHACAAICLLVAFGPWIAGVVGEFVGILIAAVREELKP